ncbi:hypothetical protein ACFYMW_01360 [Streptomyces sp. NPDC006692]|uniref:hypothetical protein n=1 Tax=Streptomyces sp. NPDC006692 TaxID=3364758 RepID=UPI003685AE15
MTRTAAGSSTAFTTFNRLRERELAASSRAAPADRGPRLRRAKRLGGRARGMAPLAIATGRLLLRYVYVLLVVPCIEDVPLVVRAWGGLVAALGLLFSLLSTPPIGPPR